MTKALMRGVQGTDLGYPVLQGDRIWLFFGDQALHHNQPARGALDPIGFTSATLPADECPSVQFVNDPSTPETALVDSAMKLDGDYLGRDRPIFSVPTGVVFDADGPYVDSPASLKNRFLAHITLAGPNKDFGDNTGRFGTASLARPTDFTTLRTPILDSTKFVFAAPVLVDESDASEVRLPPREADPRTGSPSRGRVLLVWGAGRPTRQSAVYLAAVRLEHIDVPAKWRFFAAGGSWSDRESDVVPVYTPEPRLVHHADPSRPPEIGLGCVGELSVTYNTIWKRWMMMYACGDAFPQGRFAPRAAVVLRTADRAIGPWSPPRTLYHPKFDDVPPDGDPGYGNFIHRSNPRAYRTSEGAPLQRICLPSVSPALPDKCPEYLGHPDDEVPLLPTTACARDFPSYCTGRRVEDERNKYVGCCLRSDRCCDAAFDAFDYGAPHGSIVNGDSYAPYLVQPWSKALPNDTDGSRRQRLYYVLSTWNPYTVVLMSADIDENDFDNDGVDDAHDRCPATFDPRQANCNETAENARNAQHPAGPKVATLNDACDPVPCPTASARRITETVAQRGTCVKDPYEPSVCIGRLIRDSIDMAPVGASPLEHLRTSALVPTNIPELDVKTHARFCQQDKESGFRCDDPNKLRDDEIATDTALRDPPNLDPAHMWHQISLAGAPCENLFGRPSCLAGLHARAVSPSTSITASNGRIDAGRISTITRSGCDRPRRFQTATIRVAATPQYTVPARV